MAPVAEITINWMNIVFTTALGVIGWFINRTVRQFEKTVNVLFTKHDKLEEDHNELRSEFDQLKGAHVVNHTGGRRGYDPTERIAP